MKIQSIKNVNNTLITSNFTSNTKTPYSDFTVNESMNNNQGFLTSFAGVIERSIQLLFPQVVSRAESIEARLNEFKNLNVII